MRSKVAEASRRALLEMARRMTPDQRLEAFAAHSRLLAEIHEAGKKLREARCRRRCA